MGIRANTREDIEEIKKNVDLPVIGIVKRDYPDSKVYITPTMKEIDELMEVKPEIIAVDATISLRPGNVTLDEFYHQIREKYPEQLLMADCSTVEEALHADELGFDLLERLWLAIQSRVRETGSRLMTLRSSVQF